MAAGWGQFVAARALLAACALGATVAALQVISRAEERRTASAAHDAIAEAARRLDVASAERLAGLGLKGHNAGSNPRLVAALSADVSLETLRDLFETETWWRPFREEFPTVHLARAGEEIVFVAGPSPHEIAATALVERVRREGNAAGQILPVDNGVAAVVAAPVTLPQGLPAVLLLSRPFDGAALAELAAKLGAPLVLSDGARVVLGTGAAAQTRRLKRAIGHEAASPFAPELRRWAAVILPAAPGLSLIGYVETSAAVARAAGLFAPVRLAVTAVGGLLVLLPLASIARGRRVALVPRASGSLAGTLVAPAPAPAPSSIGKYVLLERLGRGGMADVHLAVALGESGFRRPCVVKRLRPELASNPIAVGQFTDEATLASSLVHSNIVPIYDFGRLSNQHFLVQEYIAGRDLGRLVRRLGDKGRRLPLQVVAQIGVEALRALEYAHHKASPDGAAMCIVHRDVSPENVMVSQGGEVKLIDFGVMKVKERRVSRTGAGTLKGNLAFMAPEQARGEEVDPRADLFSLGLVLYFCLTGEPLFGPLAGYELLAKVTAGPGPVEAAKLGALPAPFSAILPRALAPDREQRFPSAARFAAELQPWAPAGAGRLGAIMNELFEEELRHEQRHLATPSSSLGPLASAGAALAEGAR